MLRKSTIAMLAAVTITMLPGGRTEGGWSAVPPGLHHMPDLIVQHAYVSWSPTQQRYTLWVKVLNDSPGDAIRSFYVRCEQGNSYGTPRRQYYGFGPLAAGSSRWIGFRIYEIDQWRTVHVDYYDQVRESREWNNVYEF